MPLVACPGCQTQLQLPDGMEGRQAKCPQCNMVFQIPSITSTPPAPPPPPAPPTGGGFQYDAPERAPRKRGRSSQAKKGNKVLLFSLIGGGVLLLAVLGFGGYMLVSWIFSGPGGDIRYLPDDTNVVASVKVDSILQSGAYKRIMEMEGLEEGEEPMKENFAKSLGIPMDDISSIMIGGKIGLKALKGGGGAPSFTVIVRTKKAFSADDIIDELTGGEAEFEEDEVGDFTIYYPGPDSFGPPIAFSVVESNKIVFSNNKDVLEEVLDRNGNPDLSDKMKETMDNVNWSSSVVVVAALGDLFEDAFELLPEDNPQMSFVNMDLLKKLAPDAMSWEVTINDNISSKSTTEYKDAETAQDMAKMVDGFAALYKYFIPKEGEEISRMLGDIEASASGKTLTVRWDVQVDLLISDIEAIQEEYGNMFPPVAAPQFEPQFEPQFKEKFEKPFKKGFDVKK